MLTRRQFSTTLLTRCAVWPLVSIASSHAEDGSKGSEGPLLVIVELDGGNDGLNTVFPRRDEKYRKLRPKLALDPAKGVSLDSDWAFHPALAPLARWFESGELSIVPGVSYPQPNRSHFESMRIWHSGEIDPLRSEEIGWVGRLLDLEANAASGARCAFVGDRQLPVALRGRRARATSLRSLADLELMGSNEIAKHATNSNDLEAFVERTADESVRVANAVARSGAVDSRSAESALESQFMALAKWIEIEPALRIGYVSQSGYDTHFGQPQVHSDLLTDLGRSLDRFWQHLTAARIAERVVVMVFSEFGRRVTENSGGGTDHGKASPVFLLGKRLHPGFRAPHPMLTDLDDGDLRGSVDFRSIYAELVTRHLEFQVPDPRWLELPRIELLA